MTELEDAAGPNPAAAEDVAEFVLARIAERERVARAVLPHYPVHGCDEQLPELVAFRSHNDPAFVLSECHAIRQVVEVHLSALQVRRSDDPYQMGYIKAMRDDRILRLIAVPYAGHSEYREEWRP